MGNSPLLFPQENRPECMILNFILLLALKKLNKVPSLQSKTNLNFHIGSCNGYGKSAGITNLNTKQS